MRLLPALLFAAACSAEEKAGPGTDTDALDADGDGFVGAEDCDDQHADVHPGALEICDGLDNDCDPGSDEAGLVSFYDTTAEAWLDLSADFAAGTAEAPAALRLDQPGRLLLCGGDWVVNLVVAADLEIQGVGGAKQNVLDGGGVDTVLSIEGSRAEVLVDGLTLTNGEGQGAVYGDASSPGGGGLYCSGYAALKVLNSVIRGNRANTGGGVHIEWCDVTFNQVEIAQNTADYYSGGLSIFGGDVRLIDSQVSDNEATSYGGGIGIGSYNQPARLTLTDTLISGNHAHYGGGGVADADAILRCTGTTGLTAGFVSNSSTYGGGMLLFNLGETLDSELCDWGLSEADEDNFPEDIYGLDRFSYEDDATFTCADGQCSSSSTRAGEW